MDSKPRPQDEAIIGRDYRDALPADRQASDSSTILFTSAETDFDIVFESEVDEGGEA